MFKITELLRAGDMRDLSGEEKENQLHTEHVQTA